MGKNCQCHWTVKPAAFLLSSPYPLLAIKSKLAVPRVHKNILKCTYFPVLLIHTYLKMALWPTCVQLMGNLTTDEDTQDKHLAIWDGCEHEWDVIQDFSMALSAFLEVV